MTGVTGVTLLNTAPAVYLGNRLVDRIYAGNVQVWPPGFDPLSLAGIAIWLDASQLGLADGELVPVWPDLSGLDRSLISQPTVLAGSPPSFKTGELNGLGVVRYNGIDNVLTALDTKRGTFAHFFVVAKYKLPTFTSYDGLLSGLGGSDYVLIGNAGTAEFYSPAPGGWKYHKNGVLEPGRQGPMAAWACMSMSAPGGWTFFQMSVGLDRIHAPRYWNGDVAEIIAYDRVLSDKDRKAVEGYLQDKWL